MPASKLQITDDVVRDCVVRSVQGVFRTMVRQNVSYVEQAATSAAINISDSHLIASVGFVGDANGLIYLCLTENFAKIACGHVLSMTPAEVEESGVETLHDAIGELTNMIVGGFKNSIADLGFPCKLTLPAIVRGQNLSIAAIKSASRHIHHFDCLGHRLSTDLQLKLD